jgi:3-hydroxyisobutyrate dehydrogenase-like beta-hydroxyacid dehydrogenase
VNATGGSPDFAFIGFGELASTLAAVLRSGGAKPPRAFSRRWADGERSAAARARISSVGARAVETVAQAVRDADVVLSCVPGSAATSVAIEAADTLAPYALYVDLATATPEDKERASETVHAAGARYVDAAVLGGVAASGGAVPILAAGAGAASFRDLAEPIGLAVSAIDAPAGAAARVKLLRSVYMKGRDALVTEMMLGARRHGLEDAVAASIAGPGEEIPFAALAERVLCSLALHAERRADELEASGALLEAANVEAAATSGAMRRLRLVAALDLAEGFGGKRPTAAAEVLERLERRPSGP